MKKAFPLPSYVRKALRALNDAGYEAYVVGGAVRSWLLGIEIHDYDLTTSALPEEMEQVFHEQKIVETGIKHGTITVLFGRKPVEITTYRTETGYQDHRHPDHVAFTRSLKEDCARRDFTINALCYGLKDGLIDFYGGREDLQNFLIRTVGDPEQRFEEDALRVLRALRFAAQLGFEIEPETKMEVLFFSLNRKCSAIFLNIVKFLVLVIHVCDSNLVYIPCLDNYLSCIFINYYSVDVSCTCIIFINIIVLFKSKLFKISTCYYEYYCS